MGTKPIIIYIWIKDGNYIIIESYEQIVQALKNDYYYIKVPMKYCYNLEIKVFLGLKKFL